MLVFSNPCLRTHPQRIDLRRLRLHRRTDGERDQDGDGGDEPGGGRHAGLSAQDDVMSDPGPTAGWLAVQCDELRLTRMRGLPLASEALSLGDLFGGHLGSKAVAIRDYRLSTLTGHS